MALKPLSSQSRRSSSKKSYRSSSRGRTQSFRLSSSNLVKAHPREVGRKSLGGSRFKQFKVVVTGGPSGGKTTLLETLQKEFSSEIAVVPEAATVLYRGGFPRWSSPDARKCTQRSIYFVQKEFETLIQNEFPKHIIVCDRGSMDGAAYWPGSSKNFLSNLKTNLKNELSRYDWVFHLDTASGTSYNSVNNPIRTENAKEALLLNEKIHRAWKDHPRRLIFQHEERFLDKMTKAIEILKLLIKGASDELILETARNLQK